uniref:hypothetical protein n=1 Tax=uncultured Streptococcus sp. TaxID=83427 RepID=UPI0025888D48
SVTDNLTQSYASDIMLKEYMNYEISDDYEYWITDNFGKVVAETPGFRKITEKKYTAEFAVLRDKKGVVTDFFYHHPLTKKDESIAYYKVSLVPKPQSAASSELEKALLFGNIAYELRYAIYGIALAALILMVLSFIALIDSAGRRNKTDEIVVAPLCKFPFDVLLGTLVIGYALALLMADRELNGIELILTGVAIYISIILVGLSVCMIAATNVKRKMLWMMKSMNKCFHH